MKRSIVSALFCVLMAHACQRGLRVPVVDPRVAAGRSLFEEHCVACHAMDGRGSGRGADLTGH